MIGFSKSCRGGTSHPVSPATIGALRASAFLPPLVVKSKPPSVRVVVDSLRNPFWDKTVLEQNLNSA